MENADVKLIVTENLRKTYSDNGVSVEALRGIDLTIHAGEFTAVVGPSVHLTSTLFPIENFSVVTENLTAGKAAFNSILMFLAAKTQPPNFPPVGISSGWAAFTFSTSAANAFAPSAAACSRASLAHSTLLSRRRQASGV